MVPPSVVLTITTLIVKGALLASVVVEGNPTGQFLVTVTNLNIQLPQSAGSSSRKAALASRRPSG